MYPSEAEGAPSSSPHGPSAPASAPSPSPSGSPEAEADGQQSLSTKPSSIEVSMMEVGPSKSMSEESIDVSIPQMPSNLEDDSVVGGLQQVPSKSPGPSPSPRAGGGFHHHSHRHHHHNQQQQYGTKQQYNHRAPRPPSETSTVSMASFQTVQTLGSTATVSAATAFSNPIPEGGPLLPLPPPPAGSGDPTNATMMQLHRPLPQPGRYPGGAAAPPPGGGAGGSSDMSISSGFTAGHGHGPTSGGHYYHDGYGVQPYHNHHHHHSSHPHYDQDHHSSHHHPPGNGPIDGAGSDARRSPYQQHGSGKEGAARSAEEEAGAMTSGDNHFSHHNPHPHHQHHQNQYHPHHHPQSSTSMGYGPSGYGPHHGHGGGYGHGGGGHYAAGQEYYPPRGGDGGAAMGYHTGGSGMAPPMNHHHSQYHGSSAPYGGGPHGHHGPGGMGGMHSQSAYSTGGYHPHQSSLSHHYNSYGSHHGTPPGHHHQRHHPHSQNGMTGWHPPHDRDPRYSRSRSSYGGDGGRSPETLGDSTIHTMESSSVQHHPTHQSVPGNQSQRKSHQSHSNSRNSNVPMGRSPSPTGIPAPPTTAISKPDGKGPKDDTSENRSPSAPAVNDDTTTAPTALGERKNNSALSSTSSSDHPKQESSAGSTKLKTVSETKSPAKNKADATADAASILLALGGGKSDDGTAQQQVATSANTNTENHHPRTTNYGDEASISTSSSMPGLSSGPSLDSSDNNSQRSYLTSSTGRISTSTMAETEFPCPVPDKYPRRLSLQCDASKLNSLHCFLRNELLEIFVVERSLAKTPIHSPSSSVGRVGLRCVHCAMARKLRGHSERDEAPMAVFYPKSIAEIYRLVTSWQRCHLRKCRNLPPSVRSIWQTLRENDKSRGKTHYWVTAAKQIGLLDCQSRAGGIRFAPNLNEFPAAITSSSCQPRELQQQPQPEATIVAASAGAEQPQQDTTGPDKEKTTEMASSKVTEEEPSMDQDAVRSKDTIMKISDESSPPANFRSENPVESTAPAFKATQQAVVDDTPMEDVSDSNSAEKREEDDKKKMIIGSETTAAGDADADADAGANMVLSHPVHDENNVPKQLLNDGKNSISAEKMSTAASTTTTTPA